MDNLSFIPLFCCLYIRLDKCHTNTRWTESDLIVARIKKICIGVKAIAGYLIALTWNIQEYIYSFSVSWINERVWPLNIWDTLNICSWEWKIIEGSLKHSSHITIHCILFRYIGQQYMSFSLNMKHFVSHFSKYW